MYSLALDYWYKKRFEHISKKLNKEIDREHDLILRKSYTKKELVFCMKIFLLFGVGLGVWIGYLIWR